MAEIPDGKSRRVEVVTTGNGSGLDLEAGVLSTLQTEFIRVGEAEVPKNLGGEKYVAWFSLGFRFFLLVHGFSCMGTQATRESYWE